MELPCARGRIMIDVDRGIAYNYQVVSSVFGEVILEQRRRISLLWKASGAVCVPYPESLPWNCLI